MPKIGETKWKKLLVHDEVRRWYENMARKSASSADVYLRSMARNLEPMDLLPVDLLGMEQTELENTVSDAIGLMFKRGLLGSTIEHFEKAVKSFLRWNGRRIERSNAIPGRGEHPNSEDQEMPEPRHLASALSATNLYSATCLAVMAFGGQRPQVLGKIDGSDGLRLRDLPELTLSPEPAFEKVPAKVEVSRSLSKTGKEYFTFIGPEGCNIILSYLKWRIRHGETLTPDSPLVRPFGGDPRFCRRGNLSSNVRRGMRSVGLTQRPYIWRSYFANRLLLAQSRLHKTYREFFMGHKGDLQTQYALRKKLSPETVEAMRDAYSKALPYLETGKDPANLVDPFRESARVVLLAKGLTQKEIEALNLDDMDTSELVETLQSHTATPVPGQPEEPAPVAGVRRQRIVAAQDLDDFMGEGWMFRHQLPDGRMIVESP